MTGLLLACLLAMAPAWASAPAMPPVDADETENMMLAEPPAFAPPSKEEVDARTAEVASQLRCPVCQGLSVNDSPAEGARAMKARVHELIGLGYSDEQIYAYWVDRYGTWVLLAPPAEGRNWIVYVGPLAVVLFGGLGIGWSLTRKRVAAGGSGAGGPPTAETAVAPGDDDLANYKARILAELGDSGAPPVDSERGA